MATGFRASRRPCQNFLADTQTANNSKQARRQEHQQSRRAAGRAVRVRNNPPPAVHAASSACPSAAAGPPPAGAGGSPLAPHPSPEDRGLPPSPHPLPRRCCLQAAAHRGHLQRAGEESGAQAILVQTDASAQQRTLAEWGSRMRRLGRGRRATRQLPGSQPKNAHLSEPPWCLHPPPRRPPPRHPWTRLQESRLMQHVKIQYTASPDKPDTRQHGLGQAGARRTGRRQYSGR